MDGVHRSEEELEAGLEAIRESPRDRGPLRLLVARPERETRRVLDEGELDLDVGLVGDNWKARGNSKVPGGAAIPGKQLTLMNARAIELFAGERERWPLAGDQLFVDLDLGGDNLPPGTRLELGSAMIEVSALPHTGCKKFAERFGVPATALAASPVGRTLNLRGINARVVRPGTVRVGETLRKVAWSLRTERLGFRPWHSDDLPLARALWGDARVTARIGGPFDAPEVKRRLDVEIATEAAHGIQYAPIFRLDDGAHVGCCGLRPYGEDASVRELGFHLRHEHWGKGYASEAARAVIDHAFGTLRLRELFAGHHPDNAESRRLLERLGFRHVRDELYPPTGLLHPSYSLARR